jgi:hypothetical protein
MSLNSDTSSEIFKYLNSASDIRTYCKLNKMSDSVCRHWLPIVIRRSIKQNNYSLLYDAAINDYLPIVKIFQENNADGSAINIALKWGMLYDNSIKYYLLDKIHHNSHAAFREFETALRRREIDNVKNQLDSKKFILNDIDSFVETHNYDILLQAIKSKKMFDIIIEHNFDLNSIHEKRGTLLDELLLDQDGFFKEIELIKRYGAKTSVELNITSES